MDLPTMEQPKAPVPPSTGGVSGTASAKPEAKRDAPVALSAGGEGGGGLRVSLMPTLQGDGEGAVLRRRLVVLLLVLVVETLLLGVAYFVVIKKEAALKAGQASIQQELDRVRSEIKDAEQEADAMVLFNKQTVAAHELLDNHVYWTAAFGFLEAKTKRSVTYRNFSGDVTSGTISMDAVGETYRDVAEQIVIFSEDPLVKSLRTGSASASIDGVGEVLGVTFSVVMTLDPEVWSKTDYTSAPTEPVTSEPSIEILPVEDQLIAEPQPVIPDVPKPVDPGADGGATSFDSLFDDATEPLTQ